MTCHTEIIQCLDTYQLGVVSGEEERLQRDCNVPYMRAWLRHDLSVRRHVRHLIETPAGPRFHYDIEAYGLRSSDTATYVKPRYRTKFGERGFSYAGPAAWNSLPHHLYQINDTGLFKRRLKTELFRRAYHYC